VRANRILLGNASTLPVRPYTVGATSSVPLAHSFSDPGDQPGRRKPQLTLNLKPSSPSPTVPRDGLQLGAAPADDDDARGGVRACAAHQQPLQGHVLQIQRCVHAHAVTGVHIGPPSAVRRPRVLCVCFPAPSFLDKKPPAKKTPPPPCASRTCRWRVGGRVARGRAGSSQIRRYWQPASQARLLNPTPSGRTVIL
jgi:hypothetical protein